jgi:hypothetical protein
MPRTAAPQFHLTGRPAIWKAIRALREFNLDGLLRRCRCNDKTVRDYLSGLTIAGYLTRQQIGGLRVWTLVRDPGLEPPALDRTGRVMAAASGRDQMWRAMQMRREFLAEELTFDTDPPVAPATARDYCKCLYKAGYLTIAQPSRKSGGRTRYRLPDSRITGPLPPQIMRSKAIYDPNLEAVVAIDPLPGDEP